MMLLPDIRNLFTVDLDSDIRAHDGAKSAAFAVVFVVGADRAISLRVVFLSGNYVAVGAGNDAQVAFLAKRLVYFYKSFQNSFPEDTLYTAQAILRIMGGKSSILKDSFSVLIRKFNPGSGGHR